MKIYNEINKIVDKINNALKDVDTKDKNISVEIYNKPEHDIIGIIRLKENKKNK